MRGGCRSRHLPDAPSSRAPRRDASAATRETTRTGGILPRSTTARSFHSARSGGTMRDPRVSAMADGLVGSEILRIAADVRAMVAQGASVCNLTVGDFAPSEFRPPELLVEEIVRALRAGESNYPPSDGVLALRQAVAAFYQHWLGLTYPLDSILVTSGSRPGLYATYRALVDPGETVVYPVPSWNNNHYVHLVGARGLPVVCH